jgi:demethylmenaquinone methyltransferase/2-methoxy-6-polyprenyl-1,4-benzoquinol methylase
VAELARGELPTGGEKAAAVRTMFDSIAPRYDLVNRVMTLRMDVGWRRRAVRALQLPPGARVLDVACGTGDLCRELEAAGHRALGLDFSAGMLAAARTNAPLVQADALALPISDATVDGITCGFALRNVVSLPSLFDELARVVRAEGRVALLEVAQPRARVLRAGHAVYFGRMVPLLGSLLSDRDAYRYLPRSAAYLPERDEMTRLLLDAGFQSLRVRLLSLGAAQLITATRKRRP